MLSLGTTGRDVDGNVICVIRAYLLSPALLLKKTSVASVTGLLAARRIRIRFGIFSRVMFTSLLPSSLLA